MRGKKMERKGETAKDKNVLAVCRDTFRPTYHRFYTQPLCAINNFASFPHQLHTCFLFLADGSIFFSDFVG